LDINFLLYQKRENKFPKCERKKTMKRRILAILLACMMVLSAVPFTAFAEGAEPKCPGGDKLVHTKDNCEYTKFATVEAVCGNIGYTAYTCNGCGAEFIADIVPANTDETHDFSIEISAKEPTCTEKGLTEGKHCSRCNTVLVAQSDVSAKGHIYGDWKVVTPATEEAEGKKAKVCSCGDKIEEVIPKLEPQSGCKSSVVATITVVAIVSVLGSAVVLKKKD
jgi:hypothetical protein